MGHGGKQVIHENFQSESFYFFWFPGAPIVIILVSTVYFTNSVTYGMVHIYILDFICMVHLVKATVLSKFS